ncbi:hypothetical protein [Veronia pacifica]|nr:hypothetical protein [Veronia pacifica]
MKTYLTGNPLIPACDHEIASFCDQYNFWSPEQKIIRIALFGQDPTIAFRIIELTDTAEYLEIQRLLACIGFSASFFDHSNDSINLDAEFHLEYGNCAKGTSVLAYVA